jgi:2-oxoglutarate dehydrogenase complex dehydrogenase (E1) component-like enzyme
LTAEQRPSIWVVWRRKTSQHPSSKPEHPSAVLSLATPANEEELSEAPDYRDSKGDVAVASEPCSNLRRALLIRDQLCVSSLADMSEGKTFQPVLSSHSNWIKSTSIIACSGKIFYELLQEQQKQRPTRDVAIIRLEEICPFPFSALERVLDEVEARKVIWVQEEARNQGAWTHVEPRLGPLVRARGMSLEYWGRDEDSVAAVGIGRLHEEQRRQIVEGVWQRVDACGST